jgi:deoxyhypusine synthase
MQLESLLDWILKGLVAVMAFILKHAFDKQAVLEEKVNNLHEIYTKKDDFKDFKEELWHRLDKMEETIKNR